MKFGSTIAFAVLVMGSMGAVVVGIPRHNDAKRAEAYVQLCEDMRKYPARYSNALFETEDDFSERLATYGFSLLREQGKDGIEVYRMMVARSLGGKSGIITLRFGSHPNWACQFSYPTGLGPEKKGALSKRQVTAIRDMVARSQYWTIGGYGKTRGFDGEMWYFEGYSNGKYRRLEEFCPTKGVVFDLCCHASSVAESDLTDPDNSR